MVIGTVWTFCTRLAAVTVTISMPSSANAGTASAVMPASMVLRRNKDFNVVPPWDPLDLSGDFTQGGLPSARLKEMKKLRRALDIYGVVK
jgi:hypothetical protein